MRLRLPRADLSNPWVDDGCGGRCKRSLECPFAACILDWPVEERRTEVQRAFDAGEITLRQVEDRYSNGFVRAPAT